MSDENETSRRPGRSQPPLASPPGRGGRWSRAAGNGRRWRRAVSGRPRLRKLRLLMILSGLGALALVSTVFGMMMAVASDLPQLDNRAQYRSAANSFLYDDHWRPIGVFAPPNDVIIDKPAEIAQSMKDAIIAVEDRRFMTSAGVDFRGIARAFIADLTGGSRQGASTIPQQFVKNALAEQGNRTVFEKLREAALAYHLTRKWSKQKILAEYLNSIYFGNGAYGVESAARVYFGKIHGYDSQAPISSDGQSSAPGCGDGAVGGQPRPKCASVLAPWEAALLAGMVASPSAFNPIANPHAARARRNLVLLDMRQQGYISRAQFEQGIQEPLPTEADIQQPAEPTAAPYFTSWLRPQILAAMGYGRGVSPAVAEYRAYFGGLKIRTSLDLELQRAAEQAVSQELPAGVGLPTASMVAIDNHTGEVRAMVGGPIVGGSEDFRDHPFNLATEGHRQPGSAFKPFTLAVALRSGEYSPSSIIESAPQNFVVPGTRGREHFIVHNFGNAYSGPITLANATAVSDNSVYAQVGIHVGTPHIAALAHAMGIRSPISTNWAMILGGLKEGVTPLDLAHAYESFATGGLKVFNPQLGAPDQGPTGLAEIQCPAHVCAGNAQRLLDHPSYDRVLPASVASAVHDILTGVVESGTGTSAAISGVDAAGKTGTTTNNADAWFVGWTPKLTVAVWVGYPDKLVPMNTQFNGQAVEGGTYPAIIWHSFMTQALQILASEAPANTTPPSGSSSTSTGSSLVSPTVPATVTASSTTATTPAGTVPGTTGAGGGTTVGPKSKSSAGAGAGGGTTSGHTGGGGGTTGGGGGTAGAGGGTTGGAGGTSGGGGGTAGGGGGGGTTGGGGGGGSGGSGSGSGGAAPPPPGTAGPSVGASPGD